VSIEQRPKLFEGQTFDDNDQFAQQFDVYCQKTYQILTITHSQFLIEKDENSGYKMVEWKCIKHNDNNKLKSKSDGHRPKQSYYANKCTAKFRINLEARGKDKGKYKIKDFNDQHNHSLDQDDFKYHNKQRKLTSEQEKEVYQMYKNKSPVNIF